MAASANAAPPSPTSAAAEAKLIRLGVELKRQQLRAAEAARQQIFRDKRAREEQEEALAVAEQRARESSPQHPSSSASAAQPEHYIYVDGLRQLAPLINEQERAEALRHQQQQQQQQQQQHQQHQQLDEEQQLPSAPWHQPLPPEQQPMQQQQQPPEPAAVAPQSAQPLLIEHEEEEKDEEAVALSPAAQALADQEEMREFREYQKIMQSGKQHQQREKKRLEEQQFHLQLEADHLRAAQLMDKQNRKLARAGAAQRLVEAARLAALAAEVSSEAEEISPPRQRAKLVQLVRKEQPAEAAAAEQPAQPRGASQQRKQLPKQPLKQAKLQSSDGDSPPSDHSSGDDAVSGSSDEEKYSPLPRLHGLAGAGRAGEAKGAKRVIYMNAPVAAKFVGATDTKLYTSWVYAMEQAFILCAAEEWADQFPLVVASWDQVVFEWYRGVQSSRVMSRKSPICSWTKLKRIMHKRFERQFDDQLAMDEFQGGSLKQKGGETITAWESRMQLLRQRLSQDQVNDSTFIESIIWHMPAAYSKVKLYVEQKLKEHRRTNQGSPFDMTTLFHLIEKKVRYGGIETSSTVRSGMGARSINAIGAEDGPSQLSHEQRMAQLETQIRLLTVNGGEINAMGFDRTAKGAAARAGEIEPVRYTPEQLTRWKPYNLCYKCGVVGHRANKCTGKRRDLSKMDFSHLN